MDNIEALKELREHFDLSDMEAIGEEPSMLLEMAAVGEYGSYKVTVYGGEGSIPHFHIYDKQTKRQICVKILEADYFKHGKYQDELFRDEVKDLAKWLKLPHEAKRHPNYKITNYERICDLWDENNPKYELPAKITMPDYTKLK